MCFEISSSLIVADSLRELHLCLRSVAEALAVCDLEVGACTGSALQDRPMHDLLILLWLGLQ